MTATLVSRGLDSDGAQADPLNTPIVRVPAGGSGPNQDYEDISSKVIAVNATRNATTKLLAVGDLKEQYTMGDDSNWDVIEWDPQAELIVLVPDAAIDISTDPDASKAAGGGIKVAADAAFPIHVAGSPNGRIFVKRNAGTGQPVIKAYGYGSRKMAYSSYNAFNTASSQTT